MDICGCHLRCLNHGKSCSECRQLHKDQKKDYLRDVLGVWPDGREAVFAAQSALSQSVNFMTREAAYSAES